MTPRDFMKLDFKKFVFQEFQDFQKIVEIWYLHFSDSEPVVDTVGINVKINMVDVENSSFKCELIIGVLEKRGLCHRCVRAL